MATYSPICTTVFGNKQIPQNTRLNLFLSLVVSRLLYNTAAWDNITQYGVKRLNSVYMRGLRRVAGAFWRAGAPRVSDAGVCSALGVPILSLKIRLARLGLVAQISRSPAVHLKALLASDPAGRPLPWVARVRTDLDWLYHQLPNKFAELGRPQEAPDLWTRFMSEHPKEWKELVSLAGRSPDPDAHNNAPRSSALLTDGPFFACVACDKAFATWRAKAMHDRVKHSSSSALTPDVPKAYAPESGTCPVCKVTFSTRLRLIAHLTDRRVRGKRVPCMNRVVPEMRLPAATLEALDAQDRLARRAAQQSGLTQPRSQGRPFGPAPTPIIQPQARRRLSRKTAPGELYKNR